MDALCNQALLETWSMFVVVEVTDVEIFVAVAPCAPSLTGVANPLRNRSHKSLGKVSLNYQLLVGDMGLDDGNGLFVG